MFWQYAEDPSGALLDALAHDAESRTVICRAKALPHEMRSCKSKWDRALALQFQTAQSDPRNSSKTCRVYYLA